MAEDIIKLRNLKKIYKMGDEKIYAVNDITLNFEKGTTTCLLGKSGSGKSTLLNLITGLEKPSKGEVIIKGLHVEKMNETQLAKFRQQHIGFIFQSYNLLNNLSALENVTLPLIFKKVNNKERRDIAMDMLKAVGLDDRANHRPNQLSGGQQQRVSIARAFVNNPEIIFADEPTGNLDTKTTFQMMDLMMSLTGNHDKTIIIVTHDTEIAPYASRIINLKDGKVEHISVNDNVIKHSSELLHTGEEQI